MASLQAVVVPARSAVGKSCPQSKDHGAAKLQEEKCKNNGEGEVAAGNIPSGLKRRRSTQSSNNPSGNTTSTTTSQCSLFAVVIMYDQRIRVPLCGRDDDVAVAEGTRSGS